ncbi:diadenylate cyclase CdaA [Spirochaeta africana]|uniref:Diadenylate cyclase n=1 Tax=Spirochaeta africana (strain ATCC 700263 / DSM 8902 / Z-7692) TaxID=889378 RepID=H9UI17_SPIAZ|nr:diadenylate cyclase CdaA [Spirochaeta africana]AFG37160.1 TIGR00159 family protein [Spirochaeta africana DSM 8902]
MNLLQDIYIFRVLILPALDIALLSFLIYKGYQILVQTRAVQLVKGAFLLVAMYAVAFFLNLQTVLLIINTVAPSLVIGIAIIFQPELRKIFTRIGQGSIFPFSRRSRPYPIDQVVTAAETLAHQGRGALIVFTRSVGQKSIIEKGTMLNAEISAALLVTIFMHDNPLHDGAVVLQGSTVVAAACFLPMSEQLDIRRSFGTRHRAALGLAEETDGVVLIVSEETGAMSLAYDANLYYDLSVPEVYRRLRDALNLQDMDESEGEQLEQ